MKLLRVLVLAVGLICWEKAASVALESIKETTPLPGGLDIPYNVPVQLPQFDPNLGILKAILIRFNVDHKVILNGVVNGAVKPDDTVGFTWGNTFKIESSQINFSHTEDAFHSSTLPASSLDPDPDGNFERGARKGTPSLGPASIKTSLSPWIGTGSIVFEFSGFNPDVSVFVEPFPGAVQILGFAMSTLTGATSGTAYVEYFFEKRRPRSFKVSETLFDGPLKLDESDLVTFDLDGDFTPDVGANIGVDRSHSQFYTVEIKITNTGTDDGLADISFTDVVLEEFHLSDEGEADADNGDVNAGCFDGECDGITEDDNGYCKVTVSGPVGKKGAIDPRFIVIEADTLPGGDMCMTKLYFATALASKRRGGNPPMYEPANCRVGMNDDGSDLVFPIPLNQGVAVIDDVTGEIIPAPHDPILLQVLARIIHQRA